MTDAHLVTLLGTTLPGGPPDAQQVLDALASGTEPRGVFGPPKLPPAGTWVRIAALPPDGETTPGPIGRLIVAAAGGLAEFTVLIDHSDAAGIRLYLSGGHPEMLDRIRAQLAPDCDVAPEAPPALRRNATLAGLRFRVQADVARPREGGPTPSGLLDRLSTISGDWSVVIGLRSTHQVEIADAQRTTGMLSQVAAENLTTVRQESATRTTTSVSAGWTRVQSWLEVLQGQLAQGGATGLWKTAVWALGADDWTLDQVVASLRGAVVEEQGRWFMAHDATVLSNSGAAPVSVLTSEEAAGMLSAPASSVPGLAVRSAPPSGRRPDTSREAIRLGTYWSTGIPASLGLGDLEGHAFVTGTTGSGKTTTLHRLLAEAWNTHNVPFLVLDPVKDEYSSVAGMFRGGLNVVTGGELSLNLMAAWPGEDAREHVTRVAQAFRGAFTMPSPTPYVVTQLFDQVAMQSGGAAGTELFDVRDAVDDLVAGLGYAPEAQSNIRASLLTRLNVLLAPSRAHRFAWPDSSMVDALFDRPSVVTLSDLADDEERSFVVLLLALATWAKARARTPKRDVEHLLVLEEAHRVIPEVVPSGDPEAGSAASASSLMLTSMLAEVRSYGEQVIVVDQSPSRVASDVVRNTNLKIVHRTVAGEDQQRIASAIGIPDDRAGMLGGLARGQVLVSTRREPAPQTIAVEPVTRVDAGARARTVPRPPADWPCCSDAPERHFRAWRGAASAEAAMAMFLAGARLGDDTGDGSALRARVSDLLRPAVQTLGARIDCLAWAGLRRLLVAERSAGLLAGATAVRATLDALYDAWAAKVPVDVASMRELDVPRSAGTRCPDCGTVCGIRIPAWSLVVHGPRTGLLGLGSANWRSELGPMGEWLTTERARLGDLLGARGADTLLRCQVRQSVSRFRHTPDVGDFLLARARIPNP